MFSKNLMLSLKDKVTSIICHLSTISNQSSVSQLTKVKLRDLQKLLRYLSEIMSYVIKCGIVVVVVERLVSQCLNSFNISSLFSGGIIISSTFLKFVSDFTILSAILFPKKLSFTLAVLWTTF